MSVAVVKVIFKVQNWVSYHSESKMLNMYVACSGYMTIPVPTTQILIIFLRAITKKLIWNWKKKCTKKYYY